MNVNEEAEFLYMQVIDNNDDRIAISFDDDIHTYIIRKGDDEVVLKGQEIVKLRQHLGGIFFGG